ncbi:TetR/AcrR family transcriptional regulator [Chroococcus sp. FPU101]|uniref:TetR/AcrR family transcriptional regulator n=1 Tax=Chroococcus sp. FPU101 TaxID=1974212 RepID=UPI001A8F3AA0|nr:TetR/AcrR family transcriptional regulator [Chroococcus sp. FPU101]GFE68407.1 transcriptional regulator, TetR family [Chroococcus sp. FPU101]
MVSSQNSTRARLIDAALKLFATQGVTATTTKQIAELAQVNEVTLFRHFGSKHGLLLAVIEESEILTHLSQTFLEQSAPLVVLEQAIKSYSTSFLLALEQFPEVVRSLVGEAGQYPVENRKALGKELSEANRYVAKSLETAIANSSKHSYLSPEKLASLLNAMLLGYAAIELTTEHHELWQNREDFLETLVILFLSGTVAAQSVELVPEKAADLPAPLVHLLLQQAKKQGSQEYALMYVLFGSGLTPAEISTLERSHYINHSNGQFLRLTQGSVREVPLNQWILGKRYGSYTRNPLTRWLKSRKDSHSALLISPTGEPLSETLIRQQWQEIINALPPPQKSPTIEQAQVTWCVEMLTRGLSVTELHLLTGLNVSVLQSYALRAEKLATLEKAIRYDRVLPDST